MQDVYCTYLISYISILLSNIIYTYTLLYTGNRLTVLTENETDALIRYLDVDQDGVIIWSEFRQIYDIMHNIELFNTLPIDIQRAIRKIQYSSLPDPSRYLGQ